MPDLRPHAAFARERGPRFPHVAIAAGAALLALGACRSAPQIDAPSRRPYLDAALQAADWLLESASPSNDGLLWPVAPDAGPRTATNLYSGTPGVVLFLVEAWRHTGNETFLDAARAGGDSLTTTLPDAAPPRLATGLYTGVAGIAFALEELHQATGEPRYHQGALRCVRLVHARARPAGGGVEWGPTTDIIDGTAGTGLVLLYAARRMGDRASLDLAEAAGRRLLELAHPAQGGLEWEMSPGAERLMPNFSHGTAGVSYFLAELYDATGNPRFLEGARAGARHLVAIADTRAGGFRIHHDAPDGRDLYYLGWCHGPVGTARLFLRLFQIDHDPSWMEWVMRAARSVESSGIPEGRTAGFWNNVGQCCGSAGIVEFFADLHARTGTPRTLRFARRMADDLLERATPQDIGLKWIQAEHRVRPKHLLAQTGYMQGAAGVGMALLHLDSRLHGGPPPLRLPDSPPGP